MELIKIIQKLNELKTSNEKEHYLGGSYALKYVYKILKREPKDVDIIIYNFNQVKLNWLESYFDLKTNNNYPVTLNNGQNVFYTMALLNNNAITVNFITYNYNKCLNSYATYRDMDVVPLKSIIDAKLTYDRVKDKADMYEIFQCLTTNTKSY